MLNENTPSEVVIAGALRQAVSDALHDQLFVRSLAEGIVDALEGFEDKIILKRLREANNGEFASEEEVFSALKGN
jgi:predicted transcriptional regulator